MLYLRRSLTFALALALLGQLGAGFSTFAKIKEVKIRGYVTAMKSATEFEVEDYRIGRDERVRIELDKPAGAAAAPEDLKIGSLIEVKGSYNEDTGNLIANKVKLIRRKAEVIDSTVILEQKPTSLEPAEGNSWRGTIVADGRRILIDPNTAVTFKLNKSEREAEKAATAKKPEASKATDVDPDESDLPASLQAEGSVPLTSLKDVGPGVYMTYHGNEHDDGTVSAAQVVFVKNEKEKGEASLQKSLTGKEKPADPATGVPTELRIGDLKYKVLPNAEVQAYVNRVGQSLVPGYQKELPDGNPNKLNFRFTVVMRKGFSAIGFPDGQVIINDEVFQVLETEAQLAAVLAHEIAHVTQEHAYRMREHNKTRRAAIKTTFLVMDIIGGSNMSDQIDFMMTVLNGYGRSLENQADRIGLRYLVAAGYDPREARRGLTLIDRKYGDTGGRYDWISQEDNLERRSFELLTIRNSFAGTDLDALKKNEAEYKQAAALAIAANPKLKRS